MNHTFFKLAVASVMGLSMVACGGGEPGDFSGGIDSFIVTPVGSAAVAKDNRINIAAEAETFGPTIADLYWSVEPLANSKGDVTINDSTCATGDKRERKVPNRDDVISYWNCSTTALASGDASGPFMVKATVTTDTGTQQTEGFTLNVQ